MNSNFSVVDLASLVVSVISTIVSIIFGYLSFKKPEASKSSGPTMIINPKQNPPSLNDNDIIKQKNNKTKLFILYWVILVICFVTFVSSIVLNYKTISIIDITPIPFFNSIINYLFYGIGITSKIMSPTITIFSFTLLIENIKIKKKVDRLFNIVVYSALFISSIVLTAIIFRMDFIAITAISPNTVLSLFNIANNYVQLICILQVIFISFVVYSMAGIMIVGENSSKLIGKNLRRLFKKIMLPIFTIFLIIYWNYIL